MDNIRHKFYVTVVHPFLSIYIPFSFLYTLITLANHFLRNAGISLFPPFYWLLLILAGTAETVIANYLYRERNAGAAPRIREVVFVLAGGAFLILLLNGDVFRWEFDFTNARFWLPLLFIGIQWILTFYVHGKLRYRELFLQFFDGRDEAQCSKIYQDFNHEASESYQQLQVLKRLLLGFMGIVFTAWTVIQWGAAPQFSLFERLWVMGFFIGSILIFAALNAYSRLQNVMMDGFIIPRDQRRRTWFVVLAVLAVILLFAVPFSGRNALLPEEYIVRAFLWLSEKLAAKETTTRERELTLRLPSARMPDESFRDMLSQFEGEDDRLDLRWLVRLIGWNLLGILAVLVFIFLVYPFLKGFRKGSRPRDIIREGFGNFVKNLTEALATLKESVAAFFEARHNRALEREAERRETERKKKVAAKYEAAFERAVTPRDRRLYGRVIRAFLRFARWGEQRGVPFSKNLGPLEYAVMVADKVPDASSACRSIAELFEEIQFSGRTPDDEKTQKYAKHVKDVIRKY